MKKLPQRFLDDMKELLMDEYDDFIKSNYYHELVAFLDYSSVTLTTFEEHSEAVWYMC